MESGSLSLRGWWMSHVTWDVTELKQRIKQTPRQASQRKYSLELMDFGQTPMILARDLTANAYMQPFSFRQRLF